MTKEQEKAIYRLKVHKEYAGVNNDCCIVNQKDIETVLSMLEEQDKIIDLMSEQLTTPVHSKKWIKQYFENKAKEVE